MDKQIEELANDLQEAWTAWGLSVDLPSPWTFVAEILAKKWQPKIPECVVDYIENYKEGFKEGVEAVRIQFLDCIEIKALREAGAPGAYRCITQKLDEICRELVDE